MEGRGDIIGLLQLADLYLDAWPYNGATSLLDPLQAGLPPVVLRGDQLRFNQGAAILRELGLTELIANSKENYTELAVKLGRDPVRRQNLAAMIRKNIQKRPLFLDPKRFAVHVEQAFKSLANKESGNWRRAV
jgi:predicted O-linked N-acetylglucosamine transferase (SPINDLY family)